MLRWVFLDLSCDRRFKPVSLIAWLEMAMMIKRCGFAAILAVNALCGGLREADAQAQKPNILVIMADDIGYWNISTYSRGQMGYRTPNIDRIANEGAIFTDYYAHHSSCGVACIQRIALLRFVMLRSL